MNKQQAQKNDNEWNEIQNLVLKTAEDQQKYQAIINSQITYIQETIKEKLQVNIDLSNIGKNKILKKNDKIAKIAKTIKENVEKELNFSLTVVRNKINQQQQNVYQDEKMRQQLAIDWFIDYLSDLFSRMQKIENISNSQQKQNEKEIEDQINQRFHQLQQTFQQNQKQIQKIEEQFSKQYTELSNQINPMQIQINEIDEISKKLPTKIEEKHQQINNQISDYNKIQQEIQFRISQLQKESYLLQQEINSIKSLFDNIKYVDHKQFESYSTSPNESQLKEQQNIHQNSITQQQQAIQDQKNQITDLLSKMEKMEKEILKIPNYQQQQNEKEKEIEEKINQKYDQLLIQKIEEQFSKQYTEFSNQINPMQRQIKEIDEISYKLSRKIEEKHQQINNQISEQYNKIQQEIQFRISQLQKESLFEDISNKVYVFQQEINSIKTQFDNIKCVDHKQLENNNQIEPFNQQLQFQNQNKNISPNSNQQTKFSQIQIDPAQQQAKNQQNSQAFNTLQNQNMNQNQFQQQPQNQQNPYQAFNTLQKQNPPIQMPLPQNQQNLIGLKPSQNYCINQQNFQNQVQENNYTQVTNNIQQQMKQQLNQTNNQNQQLQQQVQFPFKQNAQFNQQKQSLIKFQTDGNSIQTQQSQSQVKIPSLQIQEKNQRNELDFKRSQQTQSIINKIYNQTTRKRSAQGNFLSFIRDVQDFHEVCKNYGIKNMVQKYQLKELCNSFREVRGDGNCFYTAFGFQVIQILIAEYSDQEFDSFIKKLEGKFKCQIQVEDEIICNDEFHNSIYNEFLFRLQQFRSIQNKEDKLNSFKQHFQAFDEIPGSKIDGCLYGLSTIFFRNLSNYLVEISVQKQLINDQSTLLKWETECNSNEIVISLLADYLDIKIQLIFFDNGDFKLIQYNPNSIKSILLLLQPGHYNIGLKLNEDDIQNQKRN